MTMAFITDEELISKLVEATREGRLRWTKTEVTDRFASRYAGKWSLTIDMSQEPDERFASYWLALSNAEGEEILKIYPSQDTPLHALFDLARRRALKIDEALEDLLKEIEPHEQIKDEDIPF